MNILTSQLPQELEVGGRQYEIRTDFRTCLSTILAFEDTELTAYEKQVVLLTNMYKDWPEDVEDAIVKANWFLNGGKSDEPDEDGPRVFSFEQDANYIYSAFKQTHDVDLQKELDLHWWTFLALFMDLGQNTTFCSLTALRKRVFTGKATKQEREAARELGKLFKLDNSEQLTLEELEAIEQFEALASKGKSKDEK